MRSRRPRGRPMAAARSARTSTTSSTTSGACTVTRWEGTAPTTTRQPPRPTWTQGNSRGTATVDDAHDDAAPYTKPVRQHRPDPVLQVTIDSPRAAARLGPCHAASLEELPLLTLPDGLLSHEHALRRGILV